MTRMLPPRFAARVRSLLPPMAARQSRARLLASLLLGASLAGCSSVTLSAGSVLGNAGKTAATTMRQAALVSPADVQRLLVSDAFMQAYYGNAATAQLAVRHNLTTKIQHELESRAAVLGSLANTYDAFSSLSSYDASTNFTTSLSGLVTNTNTYLKGANLAPIPANASALIPLGGGLVAAVIQERMVRDASAKIDPILNQVIAAMEKYQADFIGFKELISSQEGDAATVLYDSGFFSAVPALNALGTPYGFAASANADKMLLDPKYKPVRAALAAVQAEQAQQQMALIATAFDQSLSALRKLAVQHAALENGRPVDLSQLAADLSALQTTVSQISAAFILK